MPERRTVADGHLGAGDPAPAGGDGTTPPSGRRGEQAAGWLPAWMGSIRFRLAVLTSSVVFGLAVVVVAVIYVGAVRTLDDQPIARDVQRLVPVGPNAVIIVQDQEIDPYLYIEKRANERALEALRQYSVGSLLVLFGSSLAVGWLVAGRLLRPIDHITDVAREITATDLSRRIDLDGPDDELRQLADTFDDMLDRLDAAFEGQRAFIHEASHELRNPLAVIRTNVDVALADPDADVGELRQVAEVVQRSAERMSRLVDDLLVYARQGKLSLEHDAVDVAALVAEAATDFRAQADERGVALGVVCGADLAVVGDRHALRQALANLVANALRFAPSGTTVTLSCGREGPWVWAAVADEGPGVALDHQDLVFQRFFRGDPAEGRAEGRSGLGLTIVRQIAEAHGGEVRLVSPPGKGATFALWIPAAGVAAPRPVPATDNA